MILVWQMQVDESLITVYNGKLCAFEQVGLLA